MEEILAQLGVVAAVVVFLLAAGESAAFVGLVVPGEVTIVLGGVVAGLGRAPLSLMMAAAISGAITGQLLSYWLGERFGRSMLKRPNLARFIPHVNAAQERLDRGGWRVLVAVRFAAVIRSFVPFVAGMSRMQFGLFLLGTVVGGVIWGSVYTLLGFAAGHQWPVVERGLRTGGVILTGVWGVVLLVLLATRWIADHPEIVRRWFIRVGRTSLGYRLVRLLHPAIGGAGPARPLLVIGALIALKVWGFGILLRDVLGLEGVFLLDLPIVSQASAYRFPPVMVAARSLGLTTPPAVVALLMLAMGGYHWWRGRRITAVGTVVALSGTWLIVQVVQTLVGRRPLGTSLEYGFPSEYTAALATLMVFALWPWQPRAWRTMVWQSGLALATLLLVAASRVLLGIEYPTDLLAGIAVGAAWSITVAALFHERAGENLSRLRDALAPR